MLLTNALPRFGDDPKKLKFLIETAEEELTSNNFFDSKN